MLMFMFIFDDVGSADPAPRGPLVALFPSPAGLLGGGFTLRETAFLTEINAGGLPFVYICLGV